MLPTLPRRSVKIRKSGRQHRGGSRGRYRYILHNFLNGEIYSVNTGRPFLYRLPDCRRYTYFVRYLTFLLTVLCRPRVCRGLYHGSSEGRAHTPPHSCYRFVNSLLRATRGDVVLCSLHTPAASFFFLSDVTPVER